MRANPLTAPYPIAATWQKGTVVLSGRVGTKQVHDAAVRMAIAIGFPFRDDLVIDTAETFRVAMSATPSMTGYGALAPNLSASYYVYPPPLFGRLDDPFFGMVPPAGQFPPLVRATGDARSAGPMARAERRRTAGRESAIGSRHGRPGPAARRIRRARPGGGPPAPVPAGRAQSAADGPAGAPDPPAHGAAARQG